MTQPNSAPKKTYEIDWETVEPQPAHAPTRDTLGLTPEDRRALGLTAPRTIDLAPMTVGDASDALAEAIARGASFGKRARK